MSSASTTAETVPAMGTRTAAVVRATAIFVKARAEMECVDIPRLHVIVLRIVLLRFVLPCLFVDLIEIRI